MKKIFVYLILTFIFFGFTWSNIQNQNFKALAQTSSSSSGSPQITLSDNFSGIWHAKVERTVTVNGVVVKEGTRPVKLTLCSKDGLIKGIVIHPGFFTRALIISQNTISENEVEVTIRDRHERSATLKLTLIGDIQLKGEFSNGVSFTAVKKNELKLCEQFRRCDINDLFNSRGFED